MLLEILRRLGGMNEESLSQRMANCVPYSPKMAWDPELNLTVDGWPEHKVFDVKPTNRVPLDTLLNKGEEFYKLSPSKKWIYVDLTLPAGMQLKTFMSGGKRGTVVFDKDISIPSLFELPDFDFPWMSITPMEVFSLRPGERLAKGHVVVAGLGLGWQLLQVANRKSVTKITLVERSQELVDWILPAIRERIPQRVELEVLVGDAFKLVPELTADVALFDVYPGFGFNEHPYCPNIKKTWAWGSRR